jgi:hypothetical protein
MRDFIVSELAARANRVARWVMADPASLEAMAARARAEVPGGDDEAVARRLIARFARRGALIGFVSGLPSNPVMAFPLAAVDTSATAKICADMAATLEGIADPDGLGDRQARDGVPQANPAAVASFLIRGLKNRSVPQALTRAAVRWAATRTAKRAVLTRMVPVVGGLLGAAWNYAEIQAEGRRLYRAAAERAGAAGRSE